MVGVRGRGDARVQTQPPAEGTPVEPCTNDALPCSLALRRCKPQGFALDPLAFFGILIYMYIYLYIYIYIYMFAYIFCIHIYIYIYIVCMYIYIYSMVTYFY